LKIHGNRLTRVARSARGDGGERPSVSYAPFQKQKKELKEHTTGGGERASEEGRERLGREKNNGLSTAQGETPPDLTPTGGTYRREGLSQTEGKQTPLKTRGKKKKNGLRKKIADLPSPKKHRQAVD